MFSHLEINYFKVGSIIKKHMIFAANSHSRKKCVAIESLTKVVEPFPKATKEDWKQSNNLNGTNYSERVTK